MFNVLTPEGLNAIANHKYTGGSYTPLDNLLNPFWAWITEFLPKWLAPNLVTLIGFGNCLLAFGLLVWSSPTFEERPPQWVLGLCGVLLWNYQTLDAMDGKQARRTNSSSALGQLFDHGCDAATTIFHHSLGAAVLCPGALPLNMMALLVLHFGFFLAQWQEYHTHVLQTAIGPVGVTEIQYFLMGLAIIGAFMSPTYFEGEHTDLPFALPGLAGTPPKLKHVVGFGWVVAAGILSFMSLGLTLVNEKTKSVGLALGQLIPVAVIIAIGLAWPARVVQEFPRLVLHSTSVLFIFITCKMILFSMSRQPFPIFDPILLPYIAVFAYVITHPDMSSHDLGQALGVLLACLTGFFLVWIHRVIAQITEKLQISCFSIKAPKKD